MKKKQSGVSIINLILSMLIVICIGIIFIANKENEIDYSYENSSSTYYNNRTKNIYAKENIVENVAVLDNAILNTLGESGQNTNKNEGNGYYYNQLTNSEKVIYDSLIRNIDKFINGLDEIEIPINEKDGARLFQTAWDAVSLDRPDIFWVDTNKISIVTITSTFLNSTKYKYRLEPKDAGSYYIDSFQTSQQVKNAIDEVQVAINNILSRCSGSTYDKIKYVHDELVNSIEYSDDNSPNNSNLYGALVQGKCVCEGYAEAFKYLMDSLKIPCVVVYGDGIDSNGNRESHAWNYVKMENGYWYAVDITWDDPILIGNGTMPESSKYKYFLKGSNSFNSTHIPDEDVSGTGQNFQYPTLSISDY